MHLDELLANGGVDRDLLPKDLQLLVRHHLHVQHPLLLLLLLLHLLLLCLFLLPLPLNKHFLQNPSLFSPLLLHLSFLSLSVKITGTKRASSMYCMRRLHREGKKERKGKESKRSEKNAGKRTCQHCVLTRTRVFRARAVGFHFTPKRQVGKTETQDDTNEFLPRYFQNIDLGVREGPYVFFIDPDR